MKRERLEFLADNPLYTKRALPTTWADAVGWHRSKDVAEELRLDWHTVKELEKSYLRAKIGIVEVSIRKRHVYRIVGNRRLRGRPMWFGGDAVPKKA